MPFTGWDWGSMWVMMLLPVLAVVLGIVVIVVLLQRGNTHHPVTGYGYAQSYPAFNPPTGQPSPPPPQQKNEVMGKVVLSLRPTLMDDERRVMDEMARAGGEVLQSDLPHLTGFSKATVSKAIHGLEVRGIVVRERHKWTYWCRVNPRLVERTLQTETGSPEPHEQNVS